MSIETKLARAMSELDERGVLVLQDPEIDTTRIERFGRGWKLVSEQDGETFGSYIEPSREDLEKTIRHWLKCQAQLDYL